MSREKPYANIFGSYKTNEEDINRAYALLQAAGYNDISFNAVEGIVEVRVFPLNREPIRLTHLKILEKFLNGEPVERSMHTLV